jgi:hypothetical protein
MVVIAMVLITLLAQYGLHYTPWKRWIGEELSYEWRLAVFQMVNAAIILCTAIFTEFTPMLVIAVLVVSCWTEAGLSALDNHTERKMFAEINKRIGGES